MAPDLRRRGEAHRGAGAQGGGRDAVGRLAVDLPGRQGGEAEGRAQPDQVRGAVRLHAGADRGGVAALFSGAHSRLRLARLVPGRVVPAATRTLVLPPAFD